MALEDEVRQASEQFYAALNRAPQTVIQGRWRRSLVA
jgi:hypothetical protein